jgi:hypothetical protein
MTTYGWSTPSRQSTVRPFGADPERLPLTAATTAEAGPILMIPET